MFQKSSPFYRRIPVTMAGENYLVLEKFEKARGFEIIQTGADGIDRPVMEAEINKFAELLKNITAQNVFIQFTTYFSRDVRKLFEEYVRLNNDPVSESIAKENIEELSSHGGIVDTSLYCTIIVPLSAEASVEGKKKRIDRRNFLDRDRQLDEAALMLKDTLVPLGYDVRDLKGAEMMQNISRIVNPDDPPPAMDLSECGALVPLRKRIFNTDFYSRDFYLTNGRYCFATLVMDTIPNMITVGCGSRILQNIGFPLVMNTTVLCEDAATIAKDLSRLRMMANIFSGKKTSAALENKEKITSIDELLQDRARDGWKIVKCFNSYLIWDKNIETLQEKIQALRLAISKAVDGAGVFTEWMRKESAFVASLPGCGTRSFDPHIVFGHDILKFVPLRGMYKGDRDQPAILLRNRYGGVTALNPFSARQNRWAGLVIGPTGSGKSVLTNGIIAGAMAYDPVVVIIDMSKASSYEPIVSNYGGSFIPVSFGTDDNRVNMFDLRVGFEQPAGSKILSLNAIFTAMLSERDGGGIAKEALSILERAVKRTYDVLFKEEPRFVRTVKLANEAQEEVLSGAPAFDTYMEYRNHYVDRFLATSDKKDFLRAEMAQCLATPTLNDFMRILASDPAINTNSRDRQIAEDIRRILNLYAQGEQAALLNGVTNFTVERDIFCIHMGLVSERKEILALLLLLYRDFAYRKAVYLPGEMPPFLAASSVDWILAAQRRPKLFVYDEFHNLKNNEPILDVLDKDARQQRTLGLATYLVTQDILDVAEKGKHFMSAASNKYFTRHVSPDNPTMEGVDNIVRLMGLGHEDRELLLSLKFYPGKYAEILALNEDIGKGIVVNVQTPRSRWRYTTHKDERFLRETVAAALKNRGVSQRRAQAVAVEVLADMLPEGSIGQAADIGAIMKKIDADGYFS